VCLCVGEHFYIRLHLLLVSLDPPFSSFTYLTSLLHHIYLSLFLSLSPGHRSPPTLSASRGVRSCLPLALPAHHGRGEQTCSRSLESVESLPARVVGPEATVESVGGIFGGTGQSEVGDGAG